MRERPLTLPHRFTTERDPGPGASAAIAPTHDPEPSQEPLRPEE